ncbi:MAG: DNA-binding response regulator [Acidobacteria bacterium]|nr:MAG: DNA-binding response regulator [Acidobacteriota bacterium]
MRVLVNAASDVVRTGLESMLSTAAGISVVGSGIGMEKIASQVEELQPDVVLVETPSEEAMAGLLEFSSRMPTLGIALLADDSDGRKTLEALRWGVRAIMPRNSMTGEIVGAIQAVAAGLVVIHPEATEALLATAPSIEPSAFTKLDQSLTPREVEILSLMAEGLGNKEIAWRLSISGHTVKFHVASIFSKLHAATRTEAVTIGLRRGLIMI